MNTRPEIEGPYRPRRVISFNEFLLSVITHLAIGGLLAYAILGMAGAWE